VIADAHFDEVRVPVVPSWVHRAALAVGAPMGRQSHLLWEERRRASRRAIPGPFGFRIP